MEHQVLFLNIFVRNLVFICTKVNLHLNYRLQLTNVSVLVHQIKRTIYIILIIGKQLGWVGLKKNSELNFSVNLKLNCVILVSISELVQIYPK